MNLPPFFLLLAVTCSALMAHAETLPLPEANIPENPPLQPCVVTPGGQRLLLSQTDVSVTWDAATREFNVSHPGWWVINYPLETMPNLFGRPAGDIRNWYVRSPGTPPPEPKAPTGPAPIRLTSKPDAVVDPNDPTAFHTIAEALAAVREGGTVCVRKGLYREAVKLDKRVILEGEDMPVISGNVMIPSQSWEPVKDMPGVFRAPIFSNLMGPVSIDGIGLDEASWPDELKPGQFCYNRASKRFLQPQPKADSNAWRTVETDSEGFLELAHKPTGGMWFASSWAWVSPKARGDGVVWDARFPQPITGQVDCDGDFRAFRQTGSNLSAQVNKYRLWVNGNLLPSAFEPGRPRAHSDYGRTDRWDGFEMQEGWNHLVFQFDTSFRPDLPPRFKFGVPQGISGVICQAPEPQDKSAAPKGTATPFLSEFSVIGPLPAERDFGLYVRLPADASPAEHVVDMPQFEKIVDISAPGCQFRGFELRHGAQFQQRAQLDVSAPGCLVEGCSFVGAEVRGITAKLTDMNQNDPPIVLRNNWVYRPGGLGIGAEGSSDKLTAENQNSSAPGRGRLICEWNTVIDNNAKGYPRFWESGGFKMFRLTGCVLRQNTFIGGDGPGIWLDWEHYNNRIEGNLSLGGTAFLVGIEASPGPNLVANNLAVNLAPGGVWFRAGILAWSSDRVWALHNTIDGRWNETTCGGPWKGRLGTDGVFLTEGPNDRQTSWGSVPKNESAINNLVVGCPYAVEGASEDSAAYSGNYTYLSPSDIAKGRTAQGAVNANMPPGFRHAEQFDYRLAPESVAAYQGVSNALTRLVRHDFNGLLRFPQDTPVAGAFRNESGSTLEAEFNDGTLHRNAPQVSRMAIRTNDMPKVEGRRLITQDGRPLLLQGFSTPGLEWNPNEEHIRKTFETAIQDWGVNVLRLPLKSTYWFGEGCQYYPQNDGGEAYRKLVDDLVEYATRCGCYVILDLHEFRAPTKRHADFWTSAAARYANHPGVLFDILNEPHDIGWNEWRNGGELKAVLQESLPNESGQKAVTQSTIGMQALLEAVRATGAENVVLAAGIDWGYDLSGIAAGFALDDPHGRGVMYSTHIYPWKNGWKENVLETAKDYPVFVGEAGCKDVPMPFETALAHDPYEWSQDILAFIQRNELNWTAWSFHPEAGPSIISDWNFTPTPYWGRFVKDALNGRRFVSDRIW